jgi:hypothetical protein
MKAETWIKAQILIMSAAALALVIMAVTLRNWWR